MIDPLRIVYSLNVEDIQTVAEERLQHPLTASEIQIVEQHIPDYINWFDAIADAIYFDLKPEERGETP